MRALRCLHDLDGLVTEADLHHRHAEVAGQLELLAAAARPDDEVSRAELLVAAAEQHGLAGDTHKPITLCRQAVADGSAVRIDARAHLVAALALAGELEEARRAADGLRAAKPRDPHVLLFVGEQLELIGDLNRALTWYTRGVMRATREDDVAVVECLMLFGRRRVRREIGFPPDDFDELAEDMRISAAERLTADRPEPNRHARCPCGSGRKAKRCCRDRPAYTALTSVDEGQVVVDLISH